MVCAERIDTAVDFTQQAAGERSGYGSVNTGGCHAVAFDGKRDMMPLIVGQIIARKRLRSAFMNERQFTAGIEFDVGVRIER